MTVFHLTDAVWDDLATLYAAGEASAETRALVEAHAREDATFAVRLRSAGAAPALPEPPAPDAALETVRRVREFLRLRTLFFAGAVFFTLLPLAFVFRNGQVTFLLLNEPALRNAFWSIAVASWVAWWVMNRKVTQAGL
jgi:hypothetical protein